MMYFVFLATIAAIHSSYDAVSDKVVSRWNEYRTRIANVSCKLSYVTTQDYMKLTRHSEYRYITHNGKRLLSVETTEEHVSKKKTSDAKVYCQNDTYSFVVSRNGDKWIATEVHKGAHPQITGQFNKYITFASQLVSVELTHMPDINSDANNICSIAYSQNGDYIFIFDIGETSKPLISGIKKGRVVLDSSRGYTMKSAEYQINASDVKGNKKIDVEFGPEVAQGIVLPKRITKHSDVTVNNSIKNSKHEVIDYFPIEQRDVRPNEFTLSHFGLPEPSWGNLVSDHATPWHMYTALIGAIFISIAILVLYSRLGKSTQ